MPFSFWKHLLVYFYAMLCAYLLLNHNSPLDQSSTPESNQSSKSRRFPLKRTL